MMKFFVTLCVTLALGFSSSAFAADQTYFLGGNARTQIGGGLPLPITNAATPDGRILPIVGAVVTQDITPTGPVVDRPAIKIKPGQLANAPAPEFALGVFANNAVLWSVQSNLGFSFPAAANGTVTLAPGGRTGIQNFTFAPGGGIPGIVRYNGTATQFGGPAQTAITGTAKVWINVGAQTGACNIGTNPGCLAGLVVAAPASLVAGGGPFGFTNGTSPVLQAPNVFGIIVNTSGTIAFRTPVATNPALLNTAASAGAPWTTGAITVSQPGATGPIENFTLAGSDARVSGQGTISLVSGALSTRTLSGPNANRGWLNLVIGAPVNNPVVPTLSPVSVAVLVTLLGASSLWMVRRAYTVG